jgi:hypothetical protein
VPLIRRSRGRLLRLAHDRRLAVLVGVLLVGPSAWITLTEHAWENALSDGLALVCGATGVALLATGLGGRRPDWNDPGTED